MNGRYRRVAHAVVMIAFATPTLGGQGSRALESDSPAECPMVGGVHVSATARDTGRAIPRDLIRMDRNTNIDTTFRFDILERRWALAEMAASVAVGLADTARGKWYLCAGAGVGLNRPTLIIRGARGQIRLRASLRELTRALESRAPRQTDPTRTPPGRS